MYKDVWKRILALVVAVCLIGTSIQWPEMVMAAEVKDYHTYQHGSGSTSGKWVESNVAAAVFTVGQNSSGGAEILDSVSFHAHINAEGKDTKATVSYYVNPQGTPDSGTFVHAKTISNLTEGQNTIEAGMESQELAAGTKFAVVVSLEGASLGYYSAGGAGQTYIYADGSWNDASASGQCVAIRAYTYDVGDDGEDGIIEQITSFFSEDDTIEKYDASAVANSNAQLNKTNMVVPKDGIGEITLNDANGTVSWSVDDPTVARIENWGDSSALVKGLAAGNTTIKAVNAGVTYTCSLKVTSSVEDAEISLTPESAVYDGNRHLPVVEVAIGDTTLTANTDYQINCVSVEEVDGQEVEGAAVSLDDLNAFVNVGKYRLTIVGQKPYSGTKTIDYVIGPKQIADETIEVALNTWNASKPLSYVASVIDNTRGTALIPGDASIGDYYLEEATNEAGEAGINIIGRGNYAGTRFCTTPKSIANAQITFDLNAYVYLGREWQPTISVAVGGVILSQTDYTVAYSNNIEAGTATVTVTGQNGYFDTASADFAILPKDISNADSELIQSPVEASVSNAVGTADPEVVVTYNGMTLTENTDYTVTCVSDTAAGTGTCTITGTGKNYTGSRTETYAVASGNIADYADAVEVSDMTYTGEALTPAVVLKKGGATVETLREGVDYAVTYTNNVNVGNNATVTVRGIGAFGGKITETFAITAADLSGFSYQYKNASGNAVSTSNYKVDYSLNVDDMKPQVIVKNTQGKTLTEGKDYKLTYSIDGMDATADVLTGTQTVTVEAADGNTNYTGSKQLSYTIQKCNLQTAIDSGKITLKLNKESFDYTGTAQKPVPTLTYSSGEVLEENRDYTVEYSATEPIEAGEYKVMITGAGNYVGYVEKAFKITKIDIQTLENIAPDTTQVGYVKDYKGAWFAMKWYDDSSKANNELELIIEDNSGNPLVEGDDYTLDYENINQVSNSSTYAKVTITGRGTYTGERVIYYLLAGKLEDYKLSISDEDLVYTGEDITLKKENVTVKTGILWWKEVLEQGVDYRINYDKNVDAGTAEFVIEPVDDDQMPTVNGCYRYTEGIADADKLHGTFVIEQKDISDETEVELTSAVVKQYEGATITLEVADIPLTYNGKELTDTDFSIVANSHVNNDAPSNNASVTINGIGNYKGTRVIPFVIKGKGLDNLKAEMDTVIYTGEALYPEIISLESEDGIALTRDKDYEYDNSDYQNNVDAGTGIITIHGLGEYLGSTGEVKFTIEPRDIGDTTGGTCTIEGVEASYTYKSQPIKPEVVAKYKVSGSSAKTLKADKDYTVDYRDNVDCTTDAAVVITGTGNYTGTFEKTFEILPKSIDEIETDIVVAPIDSQEYNGGIAVTPIPDITYNYGSSDADVYQLVSDDYTLTYDGQKKVGKATIKIEGKGNFTGERTVTYHIGSSITDTNKVSISCPDVENGVSFVYKGSAYEPLVKVTNLTTGASLELDKDYTVDYVNNTNVGTATITVQGIGSYAGKKEYNFTITPKNLADNDVALAIEGVTDGSYQAAYAGSAIEPEVTLTYNNTELDSVDYVVNYGVDHTNIGIVNVTVTAQANSNFTGTKTIQNTVAARFEIVSASIGNGGSSPADGFKMEAIEPQPLGSNGTATPTPKLYHNGVALVAGFDYTYSYEKNNAIGTDATVILTGIGNYTGSVRQKFEICGSIEGATVEVTEEIWYKDYVTANGGTAPDEITFDDAIKVTVNGVDLTEGTDYEISYANNTWVGMATVTVKGKGAYAGLVKTEVPIRADLSEATVTVGEQKYTGSPVKAVPIVEYYGKALIEGTHFIIHTYSNNTSLTDKASVTIIGNEKNGFYGTRTENFSITADAEALTVSGVAESYMYRGAAIEPSVTVKLGSKTLSASDYEVTYGTNTNVGMGTIVVKGKGSYDGFAAKSILFDIVAQDINSLTVLDGKSNVFADREYTGKAILPEVGLTTKVGTTTYTMPASDYTVTAKTDNVSVGTVTLEVTGTGNVTGSREITFNIVPKSLSKPTSGTDTIAVQVTQDTYTYDGTAKTPGVIVTYQYGTETEVRTLEQDKDYTISYSNNVAAGTASVTVSGIGNYAGSRTANFTIGAQDMSAAMVTLPNGTIYPYMGATVGVEPEVVVTLKGATLTEDKDYTLAYQNNKACGTALVTVTGKGDFNGSVTANFTIEAHSLNAADIVVASIPNQAYTGSPIVPDVKITCGTYQLVKGVDYELSGIANTEIGQAAVTIKGINGFKDSRMEDFVIASSIEQAEVSGLKDSYEYTGQPFTAEKLGITEVRIGDTILSTSDYTIGFADGYDGTSAGKQIILLIGTGNYGGSIEYEITITPKNITDADVVMMGFMDSLTYAENLTQNITLIWGTITLQKGTDYEVECNPSETAGVYQMTVAGKGNYTGTIQRSFNVEQTNMADAEVADMSSNYTYTGNAIEPKPIVKLAGAELKEGKDYTLTYLNNVNVGVATIRITSTGTYYVGEKEVTFTILRRSINHATFGEIDTQVYIGKDIKPEVTVKDNGKTLVENTDYTLMYKNNLKTGTASVVVAGKGNYTSTKTIPFAIRPCNVETITTTGASSTTVSLSWKGEGIVTGYEIYRAIDGGKWQLVGGTKGTTYTDAKLSADTSYSYKIRSYVVEGNETYYGEFSPVVNAVTSK